MKKSFRLLSLFCSFALLGGLAGCGSADNSFDSNNTSVDNSIVDNTVEIHFWHTFGQSIVDELTKKVNTFAALIKENDNTTVKIYLENQGGYSDILSKVTKGFSVGNTPTITVAYPDHVAEYINSETFAGQRVVNIQNYIDDPTIGLGKEAFLGDDKGEDDFVKSFLDEGRQYTNEGTYSIPLMKSTEVMFYNVEMVTRAMKYYDTAISTPAQVKTFLSGLDWDGLMTFAQTVKNNMHDISTSLKYPIFYDSDSNLFISKLYQEEIPFTSVSTVTQKGSINFVNDQAKAMVTALKANYDNGLIVTKGTIGTYGSSAFTNEETMFSIGSSGGTGYQVPTGGSFSVGICKIPASNENPLYVSQGPTLAMLKSSAYSDSENDQKLKYAWKFIKYLTETQNNLDLCINGSEGYVPVRTSSYETEDYQTLIDEGETFGDSAEVISEDIDGRYLITPVFKGSASARDNVGGILTNVFLNEKTINEAFEYASNQTLLQM